MTRTPLLLEAARIVLPPTPPSLPESKPFVSKYIPALSRFHPSAGVHGAQVLLVLHQGGLLLLWRGDALLRRLPPSRIR